MPSVEDGARLVGGEKQWMAPWGIEGEKESHTIRRRAVGPPRHRSTVGSNPSTNKDFLHRRGQGENHAVDRAPWRLRLGPHESVGLRLRLELGLGRGIGLVSRSLPSISLRRRRAVERTTGIRRVGWNGTRDSRSDNKEEARMGSTRGILLHQNDDRGKVSEKASLSPEIVDENVPDWNAA